MQGTELKNLSHEWNSCLSRINMNRIMNLALTIIRKEKEISESKSKSTHYLRVHYLAVDNRATKKVNYTEFWGKRSRYTLII